MGLLSAVTHAPFHAPVLRPTSWPNARMSMDGVWPSKSSRCTIMPSPKSSITLCVFESTDQFMVNSACFPLNFIKDALFY